jgi:hypothetical protein
MTNMPASLVRIGTAVLLMCGLRTPAAGWEVPLTVEGTAPGASMPHITSGVPLLAGQAKETSDLRLAVRGPDGALTAIPAQFRVLARWWRADNSIRWVLVDFATENVPGEKKVVYLTDAKTPAPAPADPVTVEQTDDAIVVSTGPARFTISRKKFHVLQSAVVDGEELLDGPTDLGLVVEDTYGERYYGAEGTASVTVVERGPLRVCLRAQGRNLARGGKGYSRGMYGYDVFMNFYAGRREVSADVVLTNNAQASIGSPTFEDASLLLRLKGGAAAYELDAEKPSVGRLAAGESVCLYQDSNGAETWAQCPGFGNMQTSGWRSLPTRLTSFRGYKVLRRDQGREEEVSRGDHARGTVAASNDRAQIVVHMRNFWQQFPKAAEVSADGAIRIGLFPRECRVPHYLEDASAKGHEIILGFSGGRTGRPEPGSVAGAWDRVCLLRPPLDHLAAAGALSEYGRYSVPATGLDKVPDSKVAIDSPRMLTDDELYGNAYGWQIFGERWRSNGGHSRHGARQPQQEDHYLFRWYLSGLPAWLAVGDARSRQYRDVRQYRVDDQDPFGFANWNEFRTKNLRESGWCSRPVPQDQELKKYQQGRWGRSGWELPNVEHTTLDLLYDRYLLYGDQRSFENMRIVAAHGGYYAIAAAPQVGRHTGWSWRAFHRYWDLTGDPRARDMYRDVIKGYAPLIGKTPLVAPGTKTPAEKNGLTLKWCHAVAVAALQTGDPQMLALARTAAEGKEPSADYYCDLFAILYHLTGEQKYKEAVIEKTQDGAKLLHFTVGDDTFLPPASHWLLTQAPRS